MRQLIYAVFRIACMTQPYSHRAIEPQSHRATSPTSDQHLPPWPRLSSCIHVKRATASLIFGAQSKLICVFMIMIHVSLCLHINLSLPLSWGNNNIVKKSLRLAEEGKTYMHRCPREAAKKSKAVCNIFLLALLLEQLDCVICIFEQLLKVFS